MIGDQPGTIVSDFRGIGHLACAITVIDPEFEQNRQFEVSFIFGAAFTAMVGGFILRTRECACL